MLQFIKMGRLALTVATLLFIACVCADYDSHERVHRRHDNGHRRNEHHGRDDGRRHDERHHYDDRNNRGRQGSYEENSRSRSNEDNSGEVDDGSDWDALSRTDGEDSRESRREPETLVKKVKMPSGDLFDITSPNSTGWRCGKRATELVTLQPSETDYGIVANEMEKTRVELPDCRSRGGCVRKYNIIKIQKIVNGCIWDRYRDKQRMVEEKDNIVNEMMLFHGTSAVNSILDKGFDERYTSEGPLGAGLYFVTSSSVANQYVFPKTETNTVCTDCERRLLLNRVSLGKVYELDKATGGEDPKQFGYAPMGFNSVMASRGGRNYDEYAVYRGDEAYPEYLITYKITT